MFGKDEVHGLLGEPRGYDEQSAVIALAETQAAPEDELAEERVVLASAEAGVYCLGWQFHHDPLNIGGDDDPADALSRLWHSSQHHPRLWSAIPLY